MIGVGKASCAGYGVEAGPSDAIEKGLGLRFSATFGRQQDVGLYLGLRTEELPRICERAEKGAAVLRASLVIGFDSAVGAHYNPGVSIALTERPMKTLTLFAAAVFLLIPSSNMRAQAPEKDAKPADSKPAEKCDAATTKEEVSTTDHTIRAGTQTIPYKATASTTLLKNDKGDSTGLASIRWRTRAPM